MRSRVRCSTVGNMAANVNDAEKISEVENYLLGYGLNRKLLKMDRYEREYYGRGDALDLEAPGEVPLARARMYEVRHFIMSLNNCDEKLFLYYHYVKGESVVRCGELLGISRSGAFRMHHRALRIAALQERERGTGNGCA